MLYLFAYNFARSAYHGVEDSRDRYFYDTLVVLPPRRLVRKPRHSLVVSVSSSTSLNQSLRTISYRTIQRRSLKNEGVDESARALDTTHPQTVL